MDRPILNQSDIKRLVVGIISVGSILFGLYCLCAAIYKVLILTGSANSWIFAAGFGIFLILVVVAVLFSGWSILWMAFGCTHDGFSSPRHRRVTHEENGS